MLRYLYCVCFVFLAVGCDQQADRQSSENESEIISSESVSKKDIQAIKFTDYGLGQEAKSAIANWLQYKELSENIDLIKNGDISFLTEDQELMVTLLNDMKTNIPPKVNTSSVKARLLALETQLLKANSLLNLSNIPKDKKIGVIKEVLIAMSNFNDQMNKKFEIESNNILRSR